MTSSAAKRKLVSAGTAILFAITGISGIIIILAHGERGISPSEFYLFWKHLHEFAAVPFLIIALIHACLNGKTLIRYFRQG